MDNKATKDQPTKLVNDTFEVFTDQMGENDRAFNTTTYTQLLALLFLMGYDAAASELSILNRKVDPLREHIILTLRNAELRRIVDDAANNLARRGFWRAAGI